MIVPTPHEQQWGWHGVYRPTLPTGSGHALPMTPEQVEAARRREKKKRKRPVGFGR